jgi:hypothetical protein
MPLTLGTLEFGTVVLLDGNADRSVRFRIPGFDEVQPRATLEAQARCIRYRSDRAGMWRDEGEVSVSESLFLGILVAARRRASYASASDRWRTCVR